MHPAVSPDGRWLAYISDESGGTEVYVRPFPATTSGRWQVSNGGGMSPAWSPDSRELFFIDNANRLVAADLRTTTGFEVAALRPLFEVRGYTLDVFHQSFAVAADGESFIFMRQRSSDPAGTRPTVVLVQHWLTELNARLQR
jgi:Tol biopolymer transport system component